jgi:hypothetical protein
MQRQLRISFFDKLKSLRIMRGSSNKKSAKKHLPCKESRQSHSPENRPEKAGFRKRNRRDTVILLAVVCNRFARKMLFVVFLFSALFGRAKCEVLRVLFQTVFGMGDKPMKKNSGANKL